MVNRFEISEAEWAVIFPILKGPARVRVGNPARCRLFVRAVLWILRSGGQWRARPEELGNWNTVFKRFSLWGGRGVWDALPQGSIHLPDLQSGFIDSTVGRAHPCAAGAAHSSAEAEALGRSRGGFSTTAHAVTDALGYPLDFVLTGGQASDIGQGEALLVLTPPGAEALGADQAYDRNQFLAAIEQRGMQAVIPPRANRTEPREYDGFIYTERHAIECFFNKIKHYRRIFSRFEKLSRNDMGFLHFVSALIWLR